MNSSPRFLSLLIIAVSVALAGFAAWAFFNPVLVRYLPWAGVLAGLLAVLHAVQLKAAAAAVRRTLLGAGLGAMALMLAIALLYR